MAKKKEKIMPLSLLPFTSDSRDHMERMKFMVESMMLHHYMGVGATISRIHAIVVETKDLEAIHEEPEVLEYHKQLKSFGKKYSIQIEVGLIHPEEEATNEMGEEDDL